MAKKTKPRKTAARKSTTRKKTSARKKAPARRKPAAKKPRGTDTRLNGWITHTEFATPEPDALRNWLKGVLGWKFKPAMPMPDGSEYIVFTYSDKGGGGIRPTVPGEAESTVPYVQVANVQKTFDKAIGAGATELMAPTPIMNDLVIALVRAPGGIMIGFAGPK